MELSAVLVHEFDVKLSASTLMGIINNLYREDLFYWDNNVEYMSVTPMASFALFSEKFAKLFPGYMLDEAMLIRPKSGTRRVNLDSLLGMLRSTDEKVYLDWKWLFEDNYFLDGAPITSDKVALVSFPRSGNTFFRKYMQLLTGVATGGDNYLHWNVCL